MFPIYRSKLKMIFTCNKCLNLDSRKPFSIWHKTNLGKLFKKQFFDSSSIKSENYCSLNQIVSRSVIHNKYKNGYYYRYKKNYKSFITKRALFISSNRCVGFDQMVPKTSEEVQELLNKSPNSHSDSKLLKVAVIGVPNSGKSTLVNQLIGWKVCSVSQKVHTTQCSARAVYNYGLTQLVFVDTPGIVTPEESKKYNLKNSLVMDPEKSLAQSDLIVVVHDVSNSYTHRALHPRVLRILYLFPTIPSVLVMNKVDLIKRKTVFLEITKYLTEGVVADTEIEITKVSTTNDHELADKLINSSLNERDLKPTDLEQQEQIDNTEALLQNEELPRILNAEDVMSGKIQPTEKEVQDLIKGKKGWPRFREVFMLSALEGTGVEDLKNYLLSSAKRAPWIFHDDVVTDQSPQEIVLMTVREKCLEYLKHNIPYELKYRLSYWDLSNSELLSVMISVYCRKKSHVKLLIGPKGKYVKRIASEAEQDLRNIFRTEVRLRINFEHNPSVEGSDL